MREWRAKVAAATFLLVGIVRAAVASGPHDAKAADLAVSRDAYKDITSRERGMRHDAALKFPGDPWSQDDDFHDREQGQARSFASSHDIRLGDALRAIDDGMREGWPTAVRPNPKVPPCRPRLSY